MNGLLVRKAATLAVVQDIGRGGLQHVGVTRGGPLDAWSMQWANAVLGNATNAATLEVSFGGLQLEAMIETRVAIGGTPVQLTVNGNAAALWTPLHLQPGDVIELVAAGARRNYLSVQGGFETACVLGSRATVLREGLGGLGSGTQARPLRAGDLLPCSAGAIPAQTEQLPPGDALPVPETLRVLPVDRGNHFARSVRKQFFADAFTVSARADRMGCRLEGPQIDAQGSVEASFAVVPGCIQVPPDGQPIVLLADCQTMGGYPVFGTVIAADMPSLGRCLPGDPLKFVPVTPDTARRAWAAHQAGLPA